MRRAQARRFSLCYRKTPDRLQFALQRGDTGNTGKCRERRLSQVHPDAIATVRPTPTCGVVPRRDANDVPEGNHGSDPSRRMGRKPSSVGSLAGQGGLRAERKTR